MTFEPHPNFYYETKIMKRLYPARMSNHFYRLVLNVQEELNTEDDPCVERADYNFQVVRPLYVRVCKTKLQVLSQGFFRLLGSQF